MRTSACLAYSIFAALVQPGAAASSEILSGPVAARVERVIDGDTVEVRARIWIDQEIKVAVRVADIDAPELFRPRCAGERAKAQQAKAFAADFLADGAATLRDIRYGKYAGRVVARLENSAGAELSDALLAAGLAVKGAASAWCEVS